MLKKAVHRTHHFFKIPFIFIIPSRPLPKHLDYFIQFFSFLSNDLQTNLYILNYLKIYLTLKNKQKTAEHSLKQKWQSIYMKTLE
jgi:hypothetical protein